MSILIFDLNASGHHLEYVHHLYCYAYSYLKNQNVMFVLHADFGQRLQYRNFPKCNNIKIIFVSLKELPAIKSGAIFKKGYFEARLLKKYAQQLKPNFIFLNGIVSYLPYIPFLFFRKKQISAIEYKIPARRLNNAGLKNKIFDNIKLLLYSNMICVNKLYLLNDKTYPIIYNEKYKTNNFSFLPDPYVPIYKSCKCGHILSLNNAGKKKFLHCGGMGYRKGTMIILEAIKRLSEEEKEKVQFIFAGAITDSKCNDEFKKTLAELSTTVEIHYIEGFLPFEDLAELFEMTDYVLVPYKNVEQSSGIIGYAAQYNKPVIGPSEGLLGELIKEYRLGYIIPQLNDLKLSERIRDLINDSYHGIDGTSYLHVASCFDFAKTIFDDMCILESS